MGTRLFSSKNENLSPLISSLKRGTLLGGGADVPSYDIRGGGRSFGEESPDPHLVSQSIDYPLLDSTYLKPIYCILNKTKRHIGPCYYQT